MWSEFSKQEMRRFLFISMMLLAMAWLPLRAQTSLEYDGQTSLKLFNQNQSRQTASYQQTDTLSICSTQTPLRWHNQNYYHTGRYSWISSNGDSVATLILTVNKPYEKHLTRTICGSLTQMGFDRPAMMMKDGSFAFADTLEARNGCDSIVILHLKIDSVRNTTVEAVVKRDRLPYLWNGRRLKESGTYTWTGRSSCGCDSIVTLMLDIEEQEYHYDEDGMFYLSPSIVNTGEQTRLQLNLPPQERTGILVEVLSQNGVLVRQLHPKSYPISITVPTAKGLYIIRVTTPSGKILHGKVLVK